MRAGRSSSGRHHFRAAAASGVKTLLSILVDNLIVGDMQRTLSCYPPLSASELEGNSSLNVVIAYEDFESGKHAKRTYDFLAQNLAGQCQLHNQMWKFDVLGIPKLCEMATQDAAHADIILVSCHGSTELPEAFKTWVEGWLDEKPRAIGLVLLFSSHEDCLEADHIRKYAQEIARRGHMEFFMQPANWQPEKALAPSLFNFARPTAFDPSLMPPLASILGIPILKAHKCELLKAMIWKITMAHGGKDKIRYRSEGIWNGREEEFMLRHLSEQHETALKLTPELVAWFALELPGRMRS